LPSDPDLRLLTFTGASGVGKTRLAIEVATTYGSAFEDGGCFVALGQVSKPSQVLPAIARCLGFVGSGNDDLESRLMIDELRTGHFLLVLDNFENVLAAAPLVAALMAACPDLKILVTSQAAIHVRGEREPPIGPLPIPESGSRDLTTLGDSPAVRLFVDRAQAVSPAFRLEPGNAEATAEICRRLDGLPLAIELAAPRIKVLSPQLMLARLERPLELLAGGPSDAPARHQTFRNTLEWSYGLLDEETRDGLLRLSVFPASFSPDDAEHLLSNAHSEGVLNLLGGLVERGLVRRAEAESGEIRLAMPSLIRQFLRERFVSAEMQFALNERLAALELAKSCWSQVEVSEPQSGDGPQPPWSDTVTKKQLYLEARFRLTSSRTSSLTSRTARLTFPTFCLALPFTSSPRLPVSLPLISSALPRTWSFMKTSFG
jgi:hypothetical protein